LSDENDGVRHVATYALGKIGPDAAAAAPDLKKNLASDDLFLKTASVWALVRIQPKDLDFRVKAVPILAKALAESDRERVRVEVATTLGEIGPAAKDAIPALEKQAKEDESPAVREAAEVALKKIRQTK
jgi:HEAT repeat protein